MLRDSSLKFLYRNPLVEVYSLLLSKILLLGMMDDEIDSPRLHARDLEEQEEGEGEQDADGARNS